MRLRERWKQARKRRRRIDEAIDKQLTPEQKLVLIENRPVPILRNLPLLTFTLLGMFALILVFGMVNIGYGLRYHFGENAWENMVEAGKAEFGSGGNPNTILYILGGIIIFILLLVCYETNREEKIAKKLKREILARLEMRGDTGA